MWVLMLVYGREGCLYHFKQLFTYAHICLRHVSEKIWYDIHQGLQSEIRKNVVFRISYELAKFKS